MSSISPVTLSIRRYCSAIILALTMVFSSPVSALANVRPARSGWVIACHHKEIHRFSAQAHPGRCNVAGYRGRKFVEVPIRGMNWGRWGSNPTFAAYGRDQRNGHAVRLIAFRPIRCNDGRTWYSRVTVLTFPSGYAFQLRLKGCGPLLR